MHVYTAEPLLKDPPRKGQYLYKGRFQYPKSVNICNLKKGHAASASGLAARPLL